MKPRMLHSPRVMAALTGLAPSELRRCRRAGLFGGGAGFTDSDVVRLLLLKRLKEGGRSLEEVLEMSTSALAALAASVDRQDRRAPMLSVSRLRQQLFRAVSRLDLPRAERLLSCASEALEPEWLVEGVLEPLWRHLEAAARPRQGPSLEASLLDGLLRTRDVGPGAPHLLVGLPTAERDERSALFSALTAAVAGWRVHYIGAGVPASELSLVAKRVRAKAMVMAIGRAVGLDASDELRVLKATLPERVRLILAGPAAPRYRHVADSAAFAPTLRELCDILRRPVSAR